MNILEHYILKHSIMKYKEWFQSCDYEFDLINIIQTYQIKSELIGSWIYCFTNPLIGAQLLCLGFWYSYKHNAYVYSGTEKMGMADNETLDQIRQRLGSMKV